MIGEAGALARQGFMPFVHSFGVFTTRRPLDQIVNAVAYRSCRCGSSGSCPVSQAQAGRATRRSKMSP